jgi:O-antigen ligase
LVKEHSVKWAGFVILVAAIVPISGWLRRNPAAIPKIWMLMGFLPFALVPFHLYVAVISWPDWPGHVKGAEFSVLDAVAMALYLSLPPARHPPPFRLSMALYFLAALLSAFQAGVPMAALFYPIQLARMFLVYAVATRACADPRVVPALLKGMAVGLLMEAALAIWQRFALGMLQADGTLGHQNLLGLMSHLVVFPFFALLLAGLRGWLPAAVVLAGVLIEVLTASRATLGLAGFGYAAVFMLSALTRWTSRHAMVLLIGVAAIAVIAPLALSNFERRGEAALNSSDDERVALEATSAAMLADHPLGVGANSYVFVANLGGYYQNSGVPWTSFSATVHNIYWLVAVETGYLGLIAFVLLLLRPLIVAFRCAWRNRGDQRGELLFGLGTALLVVYTHSFFEWVFITFQPQYMYALVLGMVAGVAEQLGYWRHPLRAGALSVRPARENSVLGSVAGNPTTVGPASARSNGLTRR